jgi:hypothetical protein
LERLRRMRMGYILPTKSNKKSKNDKIQNPPLMIKYHIISHHRKLGKKAFKSYLDIIEPILFDWSLHTPRAEPNSVAVVTT